MKKIILTYTLITLATITTVSAQFEAFKNWNSAYKDSIKNKQPEIEFFGKGDIQKTLGEGSTIPANTGIGVYYTEWFEKPILFNSVYRIELEASINVASTVDTLTAEYNTNNEITNASEFGSSVLTPLNSGQAVRIYLKGMFADQLFGFITGFRLKYIGSNRNWKALDANDEFKSIQATISSFRGGIFHEFLAPQLRDEYSINVGIFAAYNSIKGDIGLKQNKEILKKILDTSRRSYFGPEFALEIKLKNLRAEFAYSWLQPSVEIPGLSSGRLVTTISFVGGFGLKLPK